MDKINCLLLATPGFKAEFDRHLAEDTLLDIYNLKDFTELLSQLNNTTTHAIVVETDLIRQDFTNSIRRLDLTSPNIPVILIDEVKDHRIVIEAIRAGAWDVLNKPVSADAVLDSIQSFYDKYHRETNTSFREQEQQIFLKNVPDVIYALDSDHRFISLNDSVYGILGYQASELIGKPVFDLIHPEDRDFIRDSMKQSIIQGNTEGKTTEFRMLTKDGQVRYFESNRRLIFIDGEYVRHEGVVRDITKRKNAEHELKASEEKFRQLTENINEVFWMSEVDKSKLLYVSSRCESIWGVKPEAFYEDPLFWLRYIHPEDKDRVESMISKQVTGEFDEKYRVMRPDRQVKWVRDTAFPIHNENGEVIRLCGVIEDITYQKEYEDALLQERNFISTVLDNAGAIINVVDKNGITLKTNRYFDNLMGYSSEELRAKPFWESLVTEKEKLILKDRFRRLTETGTPIEGTNTFISKDGNEHVISWSLNHFDNPDKTKRLNILIGIDATEKAKAEEKNILYQKLFMATSDGIAIFDNKGNFIEGNPAYQNVHGLTQDRQLDKPDARHEHEPVDDIHRQIAETNHYKGEIKAIDTTGEIKHIDLSVFPIHNDQQEIIAYGGIGHDITLHKRSREIISRRLKYEKGLAACSQALLKMGDIESLVQEAITHLLHASGAGRVYIFKHVSGISDRDKLVQVFHICKDYEDCDQRDKSGQVELDPSEAGFENWNQALMNNEPFSALVSQLPQQAREYLERYDIKSILTLPIWVNDDWYGFISFDDTEKERQWDDDDIRLLRTAAEMIGGFFSRRLAVDAVRFSENRFRSLVENANEIIFSLDKDGRIKYISPKFYQYTGFKVEEFTGRFLFELLYPDERLEVKKWIQGLGSQDEQLEGIETRILNIHGRFNWYITNFSVIRDEQGNIAEIIAISHDITALRKALDELEKTNRDLVETQGQLFQSEKMASLGMLVAGIAHEINTPIGAASSMHNTLMLAINKLEKLLTELHKETDPKFEKILKVIGDANRVIKSGNDRVMTIIRRLRSFARLDEAELKEVDIHEGIEDTLTLIHHEIKHGIEIIREFGDLPQISCFPGKLNQVFLNILINAKQAIEGQGKVIIKTENLDNQIRIRITDDGKGINPQHIKKVFDPGFTTKGVGIGTGLGLSICYRIVQDHRGKIEVESEPGKGTSFIITIPKHLDKILNGECEDAKQRI